MDTPQTPRRFDVSIIPVISHLYDSISFVTGLDSSRLGACTRLCCKMDKLGNFRDLSVW